MQPVRLPRCSWRFTGLAVLVLLAPAITTDAAVQSGAGQGGMVSLDNGLLRIAVDRQDGSLVELTDLQAKRNLVGDAKTLGPLWELSVGTGDRSVLLQPGLAMKFRARTDDAQGTSLRLVWSDFTLPEAAACQVEVTIEIEPMRLVSMWRIAIVKPKELAIRGLQFPRVFGIRRQPNERLAVPIWMGQQLNNPRSLLSSNGGKGRRLAWPYPGVMSLQCLTLCADGGCGFYAACDDVAAMHKVFSVTGSANGDVQFQMEQQPEAQAVGVNQFDLPYHVQLGIIHGDWITAAQQYREWATRQHWATHSRLREGQVPEWVRKTGLWVWNRGRSEGVLTPAAILQKRLGLPVSVLWHWWHGCAYDIGFPEYFPPREGTEPFRQAVRNAHNDHLHMLVYMNQRAWGMSTRSWEAEDAQRYAVKGPDGKVRPEVYNVFTGKALASMCLATSFWRDKYAGLAEHAMNGLEVDGLYMDQACLQLPCYDPSHAHPLGGGQSWMQGFRMLTKEIRRRCGASRPIALAGEGCGEPWLEHLDLMLALQVSRERYSQLNDPWEVIPFFQAVYHPCAITFGSYGSLVMPPYDELWPAKFAPQEPLALLDRKYSYQFCLEQARAFVWGQQPTLANFVPRLLEERAAEMQYVMRLARVRSQTLKYLLHGEFLRPPAFDAPRRTSDFSRLSIYAGRGSRLTSYKKEHPLVLTGAWQATDGDVGIAITSIASEPILLSVAIDAKLYELPQPCVVYRIDESGRTRLGVLGTEHPLEKLTLPPHAAWVLELTAN